jgi:hypothetical protein
MHTLKQIGMGLVVISTLAMTGCGDSDDSDTGGGDTTSTTQIGTFIDAPVMGLHYRTATQDGYTDAKGTFKYKSGEKVEFLLGNLSLGKVEAGAIISPYTLAGVEDANDTVKDDNNYATNIALLLQNLDFEIDDGDILDLSKFKNHKFTDEIKEKIKLDQEMTTMGNIIKDLMNNDFKNLIAPGARPLNHIDVKGSMKGYVNGAVENHKKNIKLSDLYGKTYLTIDCSELIGCNADGQKSLLVNDNKFTYTNTSGESTTYLYKVVKGTNNIIKILNTSSSISEYYTIFLDISKNVVKTCGGYTLEKAKACKDKDTDVLASAKDEYIRTKEKDMKNKLAKTLVKNFADIQIPLYQLNGYLNNGKFNIGYNYKQIDSNGSFKGVHGKEKYKAVLDSTTGTLHVTGKDYNGKDYDRKGIVYKYDLSSKTIKTEEITNGAVFGNYNDLASYLPNSTFTFTKGSSMYCPILDDECFVDKSAINQILQQAGLNTRVN